MTTMATVILGNDKLRFETTEDWAKLPEGWSFHECASVAVDSKDNVYVFNRGQHPVIVFDREGNFLRSWGEGIFTEEAHGIEAGPDGHIYCVDNSHHAVKKYTQEGKLLLTIGKEGQAAAKWSGVPFNRPTDVAVSPSTGDLYITDGYGNARVHRFTPEGQHILSWGQPGGEPGEFQQPHNLVIDKDENIYVADRGNSRVQVFDKNGGLQGIWHDVYRAAAICLDPEGNFIIGEMAGPAFMGDCPGLGHRMCVYNSEGQRLTRFGAAEEGEEPGQFIDPHGVAVDSRGDVYVAEVSQHRMRVTGRANPPREVRSFQKLVRVR